MQHGGRDLPPRTDLQGWKRTVARVAGRGERRLSGLKDRLLVELPDPRDDPFHRPPERIDAYAPGEVIDSRQVEVRSLRRVADADAWQLAFRSNDVGGGAIQGVTTVMVPRDRRGGVVRPLLSYQAAIDALGPTADPSYTLRRGDQLEMPFIAAAARRGWAVACTDFNGPHHAFCAHPLTAHLVLDGIRAAVAFEPAGLGDAPIGLWGYSGGALATLFALERQPTYAPDLRFAGASAGGAGVDIVSSPQMFEAGDLLSGIPFAAVIGLSRGFPEIDLRSVLTPLGHALVDAAADMDLEQIVTSFAFIRWSDHLTVPRVFDIPGVRAAFEACRLGRTPPSTALHLYHAVHDRYPPVADVDALVGQYRRDGVDVTYHRHRIGGHLSASLIGARESLSFLEARFA